MNLTFVRVVCVACPITFGTRQRCEYKRVYLATPVTDDPAFKGFWALHRFGAGVFPLETPDFYVPPQTLENERYFRIDRDVWNPDWEDQQTLKIKETAHATA